MPGPFNPTMKKILDVAKFLFVVAVACLISLLLLEQILHGTIMPVSPGQIWRYTSGDGDPFKAPIVADFTVLAVSNGFVLYVSGSTTNSQSIEWFKVGARRIK